MKITVSGLPGAGKGELRKNLESEYTLESFSVGDLRGEFAKKKGMLIEDFNKLGETDPRTDIEADEFQKEWASKREDFALEGRLAYHFIPESIRVFLTVDPIIGAQRILDSQRDDEKKCDSLEEKVELTNDRCESDKKRYNKIYGIENCYDENNFDIIIDTSRKTPKQVLNLLKKKVTDYNQKMNPPKFYLGHPTRAKDDPILQARFEQIKRNANINFFNPFKDNIFEKEQSNGEVDYKLMTKTESQGIAEQDLEGVLDQKIIGGIFVYNGDFTVATQMESLTAFYSGKLNYIVTPNHGDKKFLKSHPFFQYLKTEIFSSLDQLENHLIDNRNDFFIKLRETREAWNNNSITKKLYDQMQKNKIYLGR